MRSRGVRLTVLVFLLAHSVSAFKVEAQSPDAAARLDTIERTQAEILRRLDLLQRSIDGLVTNRTGGTTRVERLAIADAPTKGSSDARIVLIQYSDFECPYCGDFVRRTLPQVEKTYVVTGKVLLVHRHRPLAMHPNAILAGNAAECAGLQGRFWDMHDALFADQQHLVQSDLLARALKLNLDGARFSRCLTENGAKKVRDDAASATSLGVTSTPTFLIGTNNGDGTVTVVDRISGAQPFAAFQAVLDRVLAGVRK